MKRRETKYLIVGGGLAGTILARTMEKYGQDFIMVDKPGKSNSSRIAGGMFNPVLFRTLGKTWQADAIIPFAHVFYPEFAKALNQEIYFPRKLVRILNQQNKVDWAEAAKTNDFLDSEIKEYFQQDIVQQLHGSASINLAGNIDVKLMIESYQRDLKKQDRFWPGGIQYDDIEIQENSVTWKNIHAEKVIFCEGYLVEKNPWFNFTPMKPAKGDVIIIHAPLLKTDHIINRKVWIVPLGDDYYKVGATYRWDDRTETPRQDALDELITSLEEFLNVPYTILDHQAAIRPTVGDRRPLIGPHPEIENLMIFNGMGTKGVMLAPYFADHFLQYLTGKKEEIMERVDVRRFQRTWYKNKGG
ncbi:MAG: FAD-binding oxidoreductase [Bacteroidales bacterium]|nr:FAD-binding oxidoreductase [Bacteroidales bacterium]MCF8332571.1 FAD-binding oxidoreductase [Bacteroidales bacterium]